MRENLLSTPLLGVPARTSTLSGEGKTARKSDITRGTLSGDEQLPYGGYTRTQKARVRGKLGGLARSFENAFSRVFRGETRFEGRFPRKSLLYIYYLVRVS